MKTDLPGPTGVVHVRPESPLRRVLIDTPLRGPGACFDMF